jgi:hypothetical protein
MHLFSNYYLEEGTDLIFEDILTKLNINNNVPINHNQNKSELVNVFLSQVKVANESFRIYEERMSS